MKAIIKTIDSCKWVLDNFPKNYQELFYLEPYFESEQILYSKDKSKEEYINSTNSNLTSILKILRDNTTEFIKYINKIDYNKENFETAQKRNSFECKLDLAINEFILIKMSKNGLKENFTNLNKDINSWVHAQENIIKLSERLENVFIFNKKEIDIIEMFDRPNIFVYCNPPNINETNIEQHVNLCNVLKKFSGKVLVFGIPSSSYNRTLKDWNYKVNKDKKDKIDVMWTNY